MIKNEMLIRPQAVLYLPACFPRVFSFCRTSAAYAAESRRKCRQPVQKEYPEIHKLYVSGLDNLSGPRYVTWMCKLNRRKNILLAFFSELFEKRSHMPGWVRNAESVPVASASAHLHSRWEIKFFRDGSEFVPPRTVHGGSHREEDFIGAVLLDPESILLNSVSTPFPVKLLREDRTGFPEKLLDLFTVLPENETACRIQLARTFFRWLHRESLCRPGGESRTDPVQCVADFLENSYYRQELSIAQIAAHAGFSQQYLNRKFKAVRGHSIRRELVRIRLVHARELLASGNYLVADAARLTGWRNSFYFSKVYHAVYGFPPGETFGRDKGGKR